MSTPSQELKLDTCGCCEEGPARPVLTNPPGQPALRYRLGTHPIFLREMLGRLHSQALPDGHTPLKALSTRDSDDPAIAFLDGWATIADVITFYQERIANEGFLRTATERRSVLELARTIGYELRPGVAASTYLAFTVEEPPSTPSAPSVPSPPSAAEVPKGTKVQSIPKQGKLPQTFETSEEITARVEWNALKPRQTFPPNLRIETERKKLLSMEPDGGLREISYVYFAGTGTKLKQGDMLLFVIGDSRRLPRQVRQVLVEPELNRTKVELEDQDGAYIPPAITLKKPKLGVAKVMSLSMTSGNIKSRILGRTWYERNINSFLKINRWDPQVLLKHLATQLKPMLPAVHGEVFAFRQRVGFFGHNAPRWETLPQPTNTRVDKDHPDPYAKSWDGTVPPTIWQDSQGNSNAPANVYLERVVPEIQPESWALFEGANGAQMTYWIRQVIETSLVDYGISGKVTGLILGVSSTEPKNAYVIINTSHPIFRIRETSAYVQSDPLELADFPITDPIEKGSSTLTLDRVVLGLQGGQPVAIRGEDDDVRGVINSEILFLDEIIHSDGQTTIHFHTISQSGLEHSYVRKTVTINANVVLATHGETVRDVLGSGDATVLNQRFALSKPPLTYISAPTRSGAESTLSLRVNDVLWDEVPSLFGLGMRSQVYAVRIDNDAKAWVIFGDGSKGSRLPTGAQNVVGTYRSGIGPDGEVDAKVLTLLQTRPLGIREVINPLAASGAKAPEKLEDAKTNAPLTIMTLERIVSLQDFEDFARAFAGVGKSQAIVLWVGHTRLVHITVAAADERTIDPGSPIYVNLVKAIDASRDPTQQVRVQSYQPIYFNLSARVLIDPRLLSASVLKNVEAALKSAFSFEKRSFGQPVTAAEVVTVIQQVEGVLATDLFQLDLATGTIVSAIRQVLPAQIARWDSQEKQILPAQLLLVNPAGVTLTEMIR